MAGFYSLENKEVIRVKVKKCDGLMQPEYKKFSIDPQITSFEMLQRILGKAFDTKSDFTISYLARDTEGQEVYLSMLSDWDMDAAFQCAAEPCLKLKVDLKPFDQELDDWDVIAPAEVPQQKMTSLLDKHSLLGAITSNISSHVGKTMSSMQRAMGLKHTEETHRPLKRPMSDMEFHNYLDSAGYMVRPSEFRLSIYQGGIESSLRRVAWRHLLNIFPENMSGRERFDYLKRKEQEYYSLRDEWKERFAGGLTAEEVKYVVSMVKKDVLRTDRAHRLYAGGDDNKNVLSLFHILVTYALTHPDVSYCQGMSDLASPLLVIQKDEAQAYICFCSLMGRLRNNFSPDGTAMMTQFRHLADLLRVHDIEFYEYLQSINAHDLFFCYRWFLLQLKREFPFEDALYMLEVMWSTLPPAPPEQELALADCDYNVKLISSSPCSPTFSFQQSIYTKLLAMRCSSRARDSAVVSLRPSPPLQSQPAEEKENTKSTAFDASPAEEDKGLEYPQIEDALMQSLQQRSSSIDQILQECGNSLTVPSQAYNHIPAGRSESKADSPSSAPDHHSCLRTSSFICSKPDSIGLESNSDAGDKSLSQPDDKVPQQCDNSSADCRRMGPSASSLSLASGLNRNKELITERSNSFVNISIELGTAESSPEESNDSRNPSLSDIDKEVQFSMSLDSHPCSPTTEHQAKPEGDDEGYSGFFGNMKKLLVSPKRRPADNASPQNISSNQNSCSTTSSKDPSNSEGHCRRGHSDSGVSEGLGDGDAGSSWSSIQPAHEEKPSTGKQHPIVTLPPPQDFGNGNPFLMFLCLTLLLQHREQIMQANMDYEDVAMFFDKMVRRHNVHKVLNQARELYTDYLRAQQVAHEQRDQEDVGLSP